MQNQAKTKDQLIKELAALHRHIAELEIAENERKQHEHAPPANESLYKSLLRKRECISAAKEANLI